MALGLAHDTWLCLWGGGLERGWAGDTMICAGAVAGKYRLDCCCDANIVVPSSLFL